MPVANKMYGNLHPRITMDKFDNPIVVWGDENGKVWLSKWGGESFAPPISMGPDGGTVFTSSFAGPDIASRGDTVYLVYKQTPEDKSHIYLKHSYDDGKHFSIATEVDTKEDGITRFPTVTTDEDGNPYVAFMRCGKDFSGARWVVARSKDMGESFLRDTLGSIMNGGSACECSPAAYLASGSAGILLYRNNQNNLRNIWAGISSNGGVSFNNGIRVDSTEFNPESCPGSGPDGVIVGDTLYSVYMSGSQDGDLVYMTRIPLSNPSLTTNAITGTIPGIIMQNFPRIAGKGFAAAAVWTQTAGGNNQVCLSVTPDVTGGFPPKADTVADGVMLNADVALGGGYIYVVWEDQVTRSVMYRRGVYKLKHVAAPVAEEATSILINSDAGKHRFTVNKSDIVGCTLVDPEGHETELDVTYPRGPMICVVSTEEADPGRYTVKLEDKDGKIYTAHLDIKEKAVKEDKEEKE